jgi:hypothetical protein
MFIGRNLTFFSLDTVDILGVLFKVMADSDKSKFVQEELKDTSSPEIQLCPVLAYEAPQVILATFGGFAVTLSVDEQSTILP